MTARRHPSPDRQAGLPITDQGPGATAGASAGRSKAGTLRGPAMLLAALLILSPLPVLAQQSQAGGVLLSFGIEQRLESDDNRSLSVNPAGRSSHADTVLSFSLSSETRSQRLSLSGSGALRASDGPGYGAEDSGFVNPSIALDYARSGPGSSLEVGARLRETDIDFLRGLSDFDDGSGVITLPEDISDLTGTGTRRHISANLALRWGQDGPLGFGLHAGFDDYSYHDTSSATLHDYRRIRVGASTQLRLDELMRATIDLGLSRYERDDPGEPRRDTISLTGDLIRDLPRGSISTRLSIDNVEEGTRLGLSVARAIELPSGSVTARLGAARTAIGHHLRLTGGLDLTHDLPLGRLATSLQRSVVENNEDEERVLTALSMTLMHALAPDQRVSLDLSWVDSDASSGGNDTRTASIGASYYREVTPDWGFRIGYQHRMRKETGLESARSNMVFMSLQRGFQFRP